MRLCLFQYRDEETARLVYEGESVSVEYSTKGPSKGKEAVPEIEELEFDEDPKLTPKDHWAKIEEKYGEDPYTDVILDYAEKLLPQGPAEYRMALVTDSVKRYKAFFVRSEDLFFNNAAKLEARFNFVVREVVKKTEGDLGVLRSAVEGSEDFRQFNRPMPAPSDKEAVKDHFDDYLDALKGRYFNADMNEGMEIPGLGIPILDPLIHPDTKALGNPLYPEERVNVPIFGPILGSDVFKGAAYEARANELHTGMRNWAMARLDWLLSQPGTTQQDLIAFKSRIVNRYASYAAIDKGSSIISGRDLEALDYLSRPPLDAVGRVLDSSDADTVKRLEVMQVMNPKGWETVINNAANVIIHVAKNNGSEDQFLATMRKHTDCDDFDDAVGEFRDMLEAKSKIGVQETLDFIREFNKDVHSDVLSYEESIEPAAFRTLVHKQMDYLLGGVLVPDKPVDQRLVLFMRYNREKRQEMLDDPAQREELFRGINLAINEEKGYPSVFEKRYSRAISRAKKFSSSGDIQRPTTHDQAAQLKALIILGHQAEVIVNQIGKSPKYRGTGITDGIHEAPLPEDPKMLRTGLKFKSPDARTRFYSALELGGFNTRDLALKGVKLIGLLAVVSNAAQAWSQTEGDFVDRLASTAEKTLSSQGALAGAAAVGISTMAERDPRVLKFPFKSEYERSCIWARFKLDNIAARLGESGHRELHDFVKTDGEWAALNHPNMTGDRIRQLLKDKAKDREPGAKPYISIQDIEEIIQDKSITTTLRRSSMSRRARYLFYQQFFGSATKPYAPDLRGIVNAEV